MYVSAISSIIVRVMNTAVPAIQRGRIFNRPIEMKIQPIDTAISVAEKVIPGMITLKAVTSVILIPTASVINIPPASRVLKTAVMNGPMDAAF